MKNIFTLTFIFIFISTVSVFSQQKTTVIEQIVKEAYENSQLEVLGHELMDDIGPRLVGTPQMQKAHDWAA